MSTVHLQRYGPGTLIARFEYDPAINEIIKSVPGREFKRDYKCWTLPLNPDNVMALRDRLKNAGHVLAYGADVKAELNDRWRKQNQAAAIRKAGDAEVDFDFLTEPYAHQRAGLAFLEHLGSGALFWEMGLGKTKTAIDFAEQLHRSREEYERAASPLRVLVVAPNTVCRNWTLEVEKHAGHGDFCLLTGMSIPLRVKNLGTARYSIVNAEALSIKAFGEALRSIEWDLIVVDESTRFKNPKAARTKTLHKLRARHRVILTGTPITGAPEDAWAQLEFVAPGTFGKSFWQFEDRYLRRNPYTKAIEGIKPERRQELVDRIDRHSFRILKSQVLDLPPKVYVDRQVTMTGDQAKAYAQMRDELRIQIGDMEEVTAWNILTVLLRLTQVTAGMVGERDKYLWLEDNAKTAELDSLLLDELKGEQVVIFGNYQFELEKLWLRYASPSTGIESLDLPAIIYGPTPEARRHELVQQFQAGDRRLLFCQIRTGGIGINLTKAQTAIYYTRNWSLEEYLQSQDRLHRIGQTGTVSIVHLVAEASIDQDIAKALAAKQATADSLTGDDARRLAQQILGR